MNWLNLWVNVVAVFGAAYVVGHSKISLVPRIFLARTTLGRYFVELLECPACFSVHAGWILTLFHQSMFPLTFWGTLGACCFYAGSSFILGRLTSLIPWPRQYHHFSTESMPETHISNDES